MLMLDRYLVAGGRALDLATGASIRWHVRRSTRAAPPPLFTIRGQSWLIDFDVRGKARLEVWERPAPEAASTISQEAVEVFRLALADARDGRPRALDLAHGGDSWTGTERALAREARLAGFVPLAADALGAVLSQARWRWPTWLRDRSLVIFAADSRLSADAMLALFRLATKDARPHLVVRSVSAATWRPRMVAGALQVHENAPADIADAGALTTRADALRVSGQVIDAEAASRWSMLLAQSADEESAGRCELARSLIAQRRLLEARAVLMPVENGDAAALRAEIGRASAPARIEPAIADAFLEILRTCQELHEPAATLGRIAWRLNHMLGASTTAFVVRDRDQPFACAYAGASVPTTSDLSLAGQTLDTGVGAPIIECGARAETAIAIRYGAAIVGAIWCRWSVVVPLAPEDATSVLGLAAVAAAPAVHDLAQRHRPAAHPSAAVPELVGESDAIEQVRQAVIRASSSPFPVLIEGESGAGKELVARAIHSASARRARGFCALNCAAIADDLVEAELFGHTRGAFTGAVAERLGLFEEAQGGTVFLDEVAELSARVQAKLLRTLQEGEVRRLGESLNRRVDARIVAATNRPLATEVSAGRFRSDLRYRLDVLRITIPPLRDRLEDVPPLVRHLWTTLSARTGSKAVLSAAAVASLCAYDWPGNVRELQNVLASIMVAGPPRGVIGPSALPAHLTRTAALDRGATLADARRAFEQRYVRAALARSGGRTSIAARDLGVSRQGLKKLTARLGLAVTVFPS